MSIKDDLKKLPAASLDAALHDPVLRLFWFIFAVIAVICFTAGPIIGWLTTPDGCHRVRGGMVCDQPRLKADVERER